MRPRHIAYQPCSPRRDGASRSDEEHRADAREPAQPPRFKRLASYMPFGRTRLNQRMVRRASHSKEIVGIRFRLKAARVDAKDG
jgi:hypothetical protein